MNTVGKFVLSSAGVKKDAIFFGESFWFYIWNLMQWSQAHKYVTALYNLRHRDLYGARLYLHQALSFKGFSYNANLSTIHRLGNKCLIGGGSTHWDPNQSRKRGSHVLPFVCTLQLHSNSVGLWQSLGLWIEWYILDHRSIQTMGVGTLVLMISGGPNWIVFITFPLDRW